MFLSFGYLIGVCLLSIFFSTKIVAARFCEGGHICSLPRECCTQGCCPPYQSGPRQLPPASDHVLNLFFISHWYFWCVVVAIILAILCAYSLWKKRRTLCGWGFPEHHAQSEGDSAGSCYAPPQYSRCNSFHHPPPPYTEVTSKPDLYPLVFTCNSDNGKNGASYLMVQYFRNYIVRPAGSLSATSTVDSLSSSFICTANEANTLVPPPYSRATSPEIGFSSHFQQHYMIPRSASQLVCANGDELNANAASNQIYHPRGSQYSSPFNGAIGGTTSSGAVALYNNTQMRMTQSGHSPNGDNDGSVHGNDIGGRTSVEIGQSGEGPGRPPRSSGFGQSQSDQHFQYLATSNSSISDIFANHSCTANLVGNSGENESPERKEDSAQAPHSSSHMQISGEPSMYTSGSIQSNPLHTVIASSNHQLIQGSSNPDYNSSTSIGGISITVPVAADARKEYRDLDVLRRSLETCCQFLQQQQKPNQTSSFVCGDSPLRMHEFAKKMTDEGLRSYVTSGTCSAVSSLANIGTPSSPPRATSPTGEVRELLDQIRQIQGDVHFEDTMLQPRPQLLHTVSSPSPTNNKYFPTEAFHHLQRFPSMPEKNGSVVPEESPKSLSSSTIHETHNTRSPKLIAASTSTSMSSNQNPMSASLSTKRPSTLQQNKKKFFLPKPNKAMYTPMMANHSSQATRCALKSPVSSGVATNFFVTRSRARKSWISRSAPTTPGTGLPPNHLGDDSPLLNEHDEDQEAEQNAEAE